MTTVAGPPLIETKLRPPDRRAGLVPRADLVARLGAAVDAHRLTVISAAAGWGKTTLVGDWLGTVDLPTAWVALDPSDNDPARFWRYLSEALARAGVTLDAQAVGALSGEDDTREVGLSELINAVAGAPRRTVIALDDYHVITEPGINASLAFLVPRLPDTLRIVLTTRTDPPIGLGRLRARGDLAEIRADDLRFSAPEAARLLRDATGADLGDDAVESLRARTEGWAAGLYLAGLSLRGRDDAAGFIDAFAGDDRMVVDYLASEVLEGQPPARRDFLMRTSVLGRLSGPLCDAVAGTSGSAQVLAELERSNLFLVPLDSRREWYRYHHLFGELLRHELMVTDPGGVAALHRRAGAWHLAAGEVDEAVHHAAAAGDLDHAADLIAAHWAGYERSGWTATTQRWLGLLPASRVRADPRLCLAEALIAINLGRGDAAAPWLDAAEAAAARPDAPGVPGDTAALLAAGRSLVALLGGDALHGVATGRRAMELSEGGDPWTRAVACLALGISLHSTDALDEAYGVLEECIAVGTAAGARAVTVVALCHLASDDLERGDVAAAERRAREAIDMAAEERHAEYPHAAGAHAALAQALAHRGEHGAAREEADRAVSLARRGRSSTETAHAITVRAEVAAAAGDAARARADLDEVRALLDGAIGADHIMRIARRVEEGLGADRPAATAAGEPLTDRELAVLRRLTGDGSMREIAADLYVSHNTVKTQIRAVYRKLGVATREEAVARARELGLIARPLAGGTR
ncbi:LuxR C-terminal-related transcriptional regulator [Miltoncostaea oceani]|uniref:LuxR C-terminal-related transcriptional regulator n=1 Tax=Miltoncostaea oceani TaxID=2843216 RepID=UPI001C3C5E1D|nr:LuxR C-terminal-related transcriptional regulator [Miltoncostaea oceani]